MVQLWSSVFGSWTTSPFWFPEFDCSLLDVSIQTRNCHFPSPGLIVMSFLVPTLYGVGHLAGWSFPCVDCRAVGCVTFDRGATCWSQFQLMFALVFVQEQTWTGPQRTTITQCCRWPVLEVTWRWWSYCSLMVLIPHTDSRFVPHLPCFSLKLQDTQLDFLLLCSLQLTQPVMI